MLLIVVAATWKQISYNFLFFLAGLQSIPRSLLEAAAIDGATPFRRFWTIVFPLLSPITFFLLVVNIVYAFFDTFGVIDATTQGGPARLDADPRLQGLPRRREGGRPRQLLGAVGDPHDHRHHAHRGAVPLRREEGAVLTMVENRPWLDFLAHAMLILGVILVAFPLYVTFVASTLTYEQIVNVPMPLVPGDQLIENYAPGAHRRARRRAPSAPVGTMLFNSLVMALGVAIGKIAISIISAFAIVYFRFPLRNFFFWMIFVTLMLPIEVRIIPTFKVASDLDLLDSYAGLTLPLIASATATFLFRQFFLTIPDELAEAARIDGAGPMRFFWDVVLPLSKTSMAALFVILFIYGWNQYLWPLLITSQESMYTVVIGIKRMIAGGDASNEWHLIMATAMLALLPPGAGGDPDAEVVREGPRGDRKVTWPRSRSRTSGRATPTSCR